MKPSLLVTALLAGSISAAAAQTTEATPAPPAPADSTSAKTWWAVGAKAGGVYSSFQGSDARAVSSKYKLGYQAGLTADFRLASTLSLHPEALYTRKGSDFAEAARNRTLTYLDVPVLLRYQPSGLFRARGVFFEGGPQASLLLSAENEAKDDVKPEFNKLTYSFAMGAGYQLANGLSVGLRFDIGISNVYKSVPAAASLGRGDYQRNAKNDAFLLSLGYSFARKH
ncbi:porin family protein [Hymenobacter monticola]|uniref:PorT family protein n=1 Tax=Hymenobacter monticola TaxID=1705399 RepID=A0ABY4B9H4_9BACT|nr:porin family protein [Hymenobacter monticola]UOE34631.1 PorT family protein [Hymenobacter monticola]